MYENGISAHDLMFTPMPPVSRNAAVKRAVMEQNGQPNVIQYGDESLRYPRLPTANRPMTSGNHQTRLRVAATGT